MDDPTGDATGIDAGLDGDSAREHKSRPRTPRQPPEPGKVLSTKKKERFATLVGKEAGMTLGKAAGLAGYVDGAREVDRLLADPETCALIIRKIQPRLSQFERTLGRAWEALNYNLDPENWEPEFGPRGAPILKVTGADRTASAALVFRVLEKIDPDMLTMRARRADVKGALRELVNAVVLESTAEQEGHGAPLGPAAEEGATLDADEFLTLPAAPEDLMP